MTFGTSSDEIYDKSTVSTVDIRLPVAAGGGSGRLHPWTGREGPARTLLAEQPSLGWLAALAGGEKLPAAPRWVGEEASGSVVEMASSAHT